MIPPLAGLWISEPELARLPTEGPAWKALVAEAEQAAADINLANQNEDEDRRWLARALVSARRQDQVGMDAVATALLKACGTENGGTTLGLGRNLQAVVAAASVIRWSNPADDVAFRGWLGPVRSKELEGRTLISTHEQRPNNWGTHAGAARMLASAYLRDWNDIGRAQRVFLAWLGWPALHDGFEWGSDLSWQANPAKPVGVNPAGAKKGGHSIDGVLPDDQRRGGPFTWPPPKENYVYEALQGALVQAIVLARLGRAQIWRVRSSALFRAYRWLHDVAGFPASGDDTWQPWVVNRIYGASFPAPTPCKGGKGAGAYTDWLCAGVWP